VTDEPAEQGKEYKWEALRVLCDVDLSQSQFGLMVE